MTKTKLILDYDYNFLLIGISCHAKDYKLAWALNYQLHVDMERKNDFSIQLKKKAEPSIFPYFSFENEEQQLRYVLLGNRGESSYLIPEQKQTDFFLVIDGYYEMVNSDELIQQLKTINIILTAYRIDPDKLKSKQNLIFD